MAEFEEKLNQVLADPDAMAQIMQLAQTLGGGSKAEPHAPPSSESHPPSGGDLFSALAGGADSQLIGSLLPLVQELGSQQDSNARALLFALKPYLKQERQAKVDRALQLARLFHIGKKFLAGWGK